MNGLFIDLKNDVNIFLSLFVYILSGWAQLSRNYLDAGR